MKKLADNRGAEEAPTSVTFGTESGRGVVSRRTCWLNLWGGKPGFGFGKAESGERMGVPGLSCRHRGSCGAQWQSLSVRGSRWAWSGVVELEALADGRL